MRAAGAGQGGAARRDDAALALVGGGARSNPWAQLLASALGTPLQRPQGAHAAAALGADASFIPYAFYLFLVPFWWLLKTRKRY